MKEIHQKAKAKLKCRYCDYSVNAFVVTKSGKTSSGWPKLLSHIEDEHSKEYKAMQQALDEMDEDFIEAMTNGEFDA